MVGVDLSLTELADEQLSLACNSHSGRAAHTLHGGHDHRLRQTLIALAAGHELGEHHSPGETTWFDRKTSATTRLRIDFLPGDRAEMDEL
jgi:hypothetical protein